MVREGGENGRQGAVPRRWLTVLGGAALFHAANRVSDLDTWWHLAGGRLVLQGTIPHTNTFSHTFPDHPWQFTQWLFGALLALGERLGGLAGVQLVQVAFGTAALLVMASSATLLAGKFRWPVMLPLFLVAASASRNRILARGDLATLLGLALIHLLWLRKPRRLPLALGVLGAVWVNLHSGAVFGLVFLVLAALAALIEGDRVRARLAAACGGAFFAGTLCNPFFLYPYRYVVANLAFARGAVSVSELLPPSPDSYPAFYVFAGLGVLPAVLDAAGRRWLHPLLFLSFLPAAVISKRFIPFFIILTFPGAYRGLAELARLIGGRIRSRTVLASGAGVFLLASVGLAVVQYRLYPYFRTGVGGDVRWFPEGACRFIEARGLSGRLFNEFNDGGYLAWRLYPERRVFVDGRGLAYPYAHLKDALAPTAEYLRALPEKFNVDVAVIRRGPPGVPDGGSVFESLGWNLVFVGDRHYVFVRPGSPDAARTANDTFTVVRPWRRWDVLARSARGNPGLARGELGRIPLDQLGDAGDFSVLGVIASYAGDNELALRILRQGVARDPRHAEVRLNLARILAATGRDEEARENLREVIRRESAGAAAEAARRELERL